MNYTCQTVTFFLFTWDSASESVTSSSGNLGIRVFNSALYQPFRYTVLADVICLGLVFLTPVFLDLFTFSISMCPRSYPSKFVGITYRCFGGFPIQARSLFPFEFASSEKFFHSDLPAPFFFFAQLPSRAFALSLFPHPLQTSDSFPDFCPSDSIPTFPSPSGHHSDQPPGLPSFFFRFIEPRWFLFFILGPLAPPFLFTVVCMSGDLYRFCFPFSAGAFCVHQVVTVGTPPTQRSPCFLFFFPPLTLSSHWSLSVWTGSRLSLSRFKCGKFLFNASLVTTLCLPRPFSDWVLYLAWWKE